MYYVFSVAYLDQAPNLIMDSDKDNNFGAYKIKWVRIPLCLYKLGMGGGKLSTLRLKDRKIIQKITFLR